MNTITPELKILFVVNKASGSNTTDYSQVIDTYFRDKEHISAIVFECVGEGLKESLRKKLEEVQPHIAVAVGGDGTVKLVAEMIMGKDIKLGILPAGSANGMAKELDIPAEPEAALDLILKGHTRAIHLLRVNNNLCIHLSDIGFNAHLVKKFERMPERGMLGYIKAAWKVLWRHYKMEAKFNINHQSVKRDAVMIVLANATSYGTGVTINPVGQLDDDLFEVVIVRKISFTEILKMRFSGKPFNPEKTELFQTSAITIHSRKKVHFQVDGEYLGKVNELVAEILPGALNIIC